MADTCKAPKDSPRFAEGDTSDTILSRKTTLPILFDLIKGKGCPAEPMSGVQEVKEEEKAGVNVTPDEAATKIQAPWSAC